MSASLEMRLPHAIDQVVVIEGAEHALEQGRPLLGRLTGRQCSNGGVGKLVSPCPVLCEQSRSACIHDRPLLLALTLVRRGCRSIDARCNSTSRRNGLRSRQAGVARPPRCGNALGASSPSVAIATLRRPRPGSSPSPPRGGPLLCRKRR